MSRKKGKEADMVKTKQNKSQINQITKKAEQQLMEYSYKLLIYYYSSLESSLKESKPVAIQLRMLEVFTSCDSFHNAADPAGSRKDAAIVTVYLVRNGEHFLPQNIPFFCRF